MKTFGIPIAFAVALAVTVPALAQAQLPGAADTARVSAGRYSVDTNHTQVVWSVNHMGVSPLSGALAASGGALVLDPARPSTAKVSVTFNVADMSTTAPAFTKHLLSADFFDAEKFPTVSFTSRSVQVKGQTAKIMGDLTIRGVPKRVTLDAKFFGAGTNPMSKKLDIGFSATGQIKRSEFGMNYGVPGVTPDLVDLRIAAAFTRTD